MSALMLRTGRWALGLWILASATNSAAEGLQNLPTDGWVAWDVPTVDGAPGWCCFENSSIQRIGSQATVCNLDDKHFGFGTRRGEITDSLRIHVRLAGGKVERIRSLSTRCATTTSSPEKFLQGVPVAASVAWLGRLIAQTPESVGKHLRGIGADALAALAVHRGNEARNLLVNLVSPASVGAAQPRIEIRKEAMFWLTQVRGQEGFDIVAPYLHNDNDAKIREHVAFCISQTRIAAATAIEALIRQGESDRDAGVRSKAWFWLAQIKSPPAGGSEKIEKAIARAVKQDRDPKVRHEAIFALSQLAAGRAVPALRRIAEDRSLDSAERKQAVFWISHNGGADALAYIDQVLSKTALSP
jgi:hypothetical protein